MIALSVQSADITLLGREEELSRLAALLDAAHHRRSGALVVRGDSGVGKSALLEEACDRAERMQVLRSRGIESEAQLPFAALHQLVRPIVDHLERLPTVQAAALRGALGLESDGGDRRFLVSVALLSLLAEAAEDQPVVCLVDDAHWVDEASLDALVFVARRLAAEGIAMLFGVRDGARSALDDAGLPELELRGLDATAATALLDRHAGETLSREVRDRLVAATGGNPLALMELSSALTDAQRSGAESLVGPLPVSAQIERAFLTRVRQLSPEAQTVLLVAAADDHGELPTVLGAAGALGIAPDVLDEAERDGLVRVVADRLEFRHPLVRSAIYHGAPLSARRAAHRALAETLTGDQVADRRAWHRAACTVEPDQAVVDDLERAAERARRRGGFLAASRASERAAALTVDPERRGRQLAAAGECAWSAGRPDRARALLERARRITHQPLLRADLDRTLAVIQMACGAPDDAWRMLLGTADDVAPHDGVRALHALTIAGWAAAYAGAGDACEQISRRAEAVQVPDEPVPRFLQDLLRGLYAYNVADYATASTMLGAALRRVLDAEAAGSDELDDLLLYAAGAALHLGDDVLLGRIMRRVAARARDIGDLGLLPHALTGVALADMWTGHWSSAVSVLWEGADIAEETGQTQMVAYLLAELAVVAGLRGEEENCRSLAARSVELESAGGLLSVSYFANWALLALELGLGNVEAALARARATQNAAHMSTGAFDRIEAAILAGETGLAREWLEPFETWARVGPAVWARAAALHCRALLAEDAADAEDLFRAALATHEDAQRPLERARTQLAFGAFLRRARRRREAREHLSAALDAFEILGAKPWAERARAELRSSGQTARRRDPSTLDELTPQELQIAQLVAQGLTNRDVAGKLFLSPRTIDFHLRNVFRKLDISSRTQLARLALGGMTEPLPAV